MSSSDALDQKRNNNPPWWSLALRFADSANSPQGYKWGRTLSYVLDAL